jgi:hypothetical protein
MQVSLLGITVVELSPLRSMAVRGSFFDCFIPKIAVFSYGAALGLYPNLNANANLGVKPEMHIDQIKLRAKS